MTIEEFNQQLSKLVTELFKGMEVGVVPIHMRWQLQEDPPDHHNPLQISLTIRRVWRE